MSQHEDDDDGGVAIFAIIALVVFFLLVILFYELKFAWVWGFERFKGRGWSGFPNLDGALGGLFACMALLGAMLLSGFGFVIHSDLRFARDVFSGIVNLNWGGYWSVESFLEAFARGFAFVNVIFLVALAGYGLRRLWLWLFKRSESKMEEEASTPEMMRPGLENVIRFPK